MPNCCFDKCSYTFLSLKTVVKQFQYRLQAGVTLSEFGITAGRLSRDLSQVFNKLKSGSFHCDYVKLLLSKFGNTSHLTCTSN